MTITIDTLTIGLNTPYTIERVNLSIPKISISMDGLPSTNRSQFYSNFISSRSIPIQGTIVGTSIADYQAKRDLLQATLYPKQGQRLPITITTISGAVRTTSGFLSDFDAESTDEGLTFGKYSFKIDCDDPNFYDLASTVQNLSLNPGGLELDFGFDADLGNGSGSTLTFTYSGTSTVKPILTITGPGTNFSITKDGKTFNLNVLLYTGQTAIIDSLEETVSIGGVSYYSYANNFQALEITPGTNTFMFVVENDSNFNTAAQFSFKNAYISI